MWVLSPFYHTFREALSQPLPILNEGAPSGEHYRKAGKPVAKWEESLYAPLAPPTFWFGAAKYVSDVRKALGHTLPSPLPRCVAFGLTAGGGYRRIKR